MDPELKKLIEETHALAKDNHDMLRAIRRDQWIAFFTKIVVWVVILALPIYLYRLYLEPIVTKLSEASGMSSTTTTGILGLPSSAEVQKLIDSLKAAQQSR